jgi:hypothetical protein
MEGGSATRAGFIDLGASSQRGQQVMNNDEMEQRIRTAFGTDMQAFAQAQLEMAADDMVQEWPQSGERIHGLENLRAVGENYATATGTSPKMTLRRILQPGKAWVIEGVIDYGDGVPVSAVSIIETNEAGKITHETDYFANPFEAPDCLAFQAQALAVAEGPARRQAAIGQGQALESRDQYGRGQNPVQFGRQALENALDILSAQNHQRPRHGGNMRSRGRR